MWIKHQKRCLVPCLHRPDWQALQKWQKNLKNKLKNKFKKLEILHVGRVGWDADAHHLHSKNLRWLLSSTDEDYLFQETVTSTYIYNGNLCECLRIFTLLLRSISCLLYSMEGRILHFLQDSAVQSDNTQRNHRVITMYYVVPLW